NISFTNTVSRVQVAADANLSHVRLQQEANEAFHLADIEVEQEGKSYFASHSISLGARLARHDIATRFGGQRAESLLNGIYFADGQRHVDHHTEIDAVEDRKSTRLNSSHVKNSYAVFSLKKR